MMQSCSTKQVKCEFWAIPSFFISVLYQHAAGPRDFRGFSVHAPSSTLVGLPYRCHWRACACTTNISTSSDFDHRKEATPNCLGPATLLCQLIMNMPQSHRVQVTRLTQSPWIARYCNPPLFALQPQVRTAGSGLWSPLRCIHHIARKQCLLIVIATGGHCLCSPYPWSMRYTSGHCCWPGWAPPPRPHQGPCQPWPVAWHYNMGMQACRRTVLSARTRTRTGTCSQTHKTRACTHTS